MVDLELWDIKARHVHHMLDLLILKEIYENTSKGRG